MKYAVNELNRALSMLDCDRQSCEEDNEVYSKSLSQGREKLEVIHEAIHDTRKAIIALGGEVVSPKTTSEMCDGPVNLRMDRGKHA